MTANGTTERGTDIGYIGIALSADRNTDGDVFVDGENDLPLQKDEHLDAAASERDKASAKLKRNRLLFGRVQDSIDNNISKPAPRDYPVWKKRLIILVMTYAAAIGPTGTTLYLPGVAQIQEDLNTSYTAVNASLAVTSFVTAIFPLLWAAFGDIFGRKNPLLTGLAIGSLCNVCAAISIHAGMLIVFRGLAGAGTSVATVCAGIITDLYDDKQQGRAYSTFLLGPVIGPAIGPIIGGLLTKAFRWRSTLYFMAAYCLSAWILILLFVPETSSKKNIDECNIKQKKPEKSVRVRSVKLLSALKLFAYPNLLLICLVCGISNCAYYFNITAYTWIYINQYGLKPDMFSLCYLAVTFGSIIGNSLGGRLSDSIYIKTVSRAEAQGKESNFEMRLGGTMLSIYYIVWLLCISAFGWCVQEHLHLAFGIVCEFFANTCCAATLVILSTYLINSFENQSSAVNACNYFARFTLATIGEIFASDLLAAIPTGPLFTATGVLVILAALSIIYIKRKPLKWKQMREESTDSS